ncbi:MAG: DNA ligase-associated DEXH box helicase, partial [Chitinophagaceae bacterium]
MPTHSLELVEAAALKKAAEKAEMESKLPLQLCFDVLIQYACTLAVGGGFNAHELWEEVTKTYCFADMQPAEWQQVLLHITNGGAALQEYHEYQKVVV